jgi:nudix-type nucleoside diphosphatase (YffH/AdpP family)
MSNDNNAMHDRIRIRQEDTLSDNWAILKKTTLDYQREDGGWQTLTRETYDRGNGATILLYNRAKGTVILTRQFRYPAYVNGHHGVLIETCGGLLDDLDPATAIRLETEQETGYRISEPRKVMEAFMSPGSVTERVYFFVAEYDAESRVSAGGGLLNEGEDIDVLELPFDETLRMIERGEIIDGKTIILLQYAGLHGLLEG